MSPEPAVPADLTPDQWAQLVSVLSLDSARDFYGAMGVPVSDPADFQPMLRTVILEARRMHETSPDRVPPVASLLTEQLSAPEAAAFLNWARGVFLGYHADQPGWSAWEIVFLHWAYSRQRDLDFLPGPTRGALVAAFRRDVETDDVRQQGEQAAEQPLSDWDREIYARRNYSGTWESGPYSTIESITRIERLKRLVASIWPSLTPAEREEMYHRAQALLTSLDVWMPGPLPRLSDLPDGPS